MKLFTTCYTIQKTPAEAQIAAKYDLLIVNQDDGTSHKAWLDSVKAINPAVKMLAYQMVAQEPGIAPGAGNRILPDINRFAAYSQDPWLITASGDIAAIQIDGWKNRRMYDYRKLVWQDLFKQACQAVLASYQFDGLFLDNCVSNWAKQAPANPALHDALKNVLLDLRRLYPDKWMIGNGSENWMGLNGEMSEGRIGQLSELTPSAGQVVPNLNCYLMPTTTATTDAEIQAAYNQVKPYGAWFGCHRADGVLYWPSIFDTLEA